MISQIQNIQTFIAGQLSDVIDYGKHVRPDPQHVRPDFPNAHNGDAAYVEIATPHNRYKMSVLSAYVTPPPGAPVTCRSLGTVTFYDPADGKQIVGPKGDQTYADISKHIHVREYTDALAVARCQMAEASPEMAGPVRVKLADLASRAEKWGIKAKVPEEPKLSEIAALPQHHNVPIRIVDDLNHANRYAHDLGPLPSASGLASGGDPHHPTPFVGCPIVYITNPGEQVSGMREIPGHCVKVFSPDRITIFITPDNSEPGYRDNLARRGSDAGNGRLHQSNCWDFNPEWLRELARIKTLEDDVASLRDVVFDDLKEWAKSAECRLKGIADELDRRAERLAALEAKPKRGRSPNPSTSAQDEGAEPQPDTEPAV